MKRLSIFVSGGGTNLQRIAEYFAEKPECSLSAQKTHSFQNPPFSEADDTDIESL